MQPIASGLFTKDDPPRLIGGRDRATGRIVFPCPPGDGFEAVPLSRTGTLWSYTIQRFRPKSPPYAGPEAFTPWALGYVELPGETIVEARLTDVEFGAIEIGMPLELTQVPLDPDAAESVAIPAFRPEGASA
ncbi:Zn-ribbon domain-containing OB-fold protein [Croceicoccus sp. YJ47]|uniref:Zn-ribbon domain-containing OB-fold protein n=1 Tax=Croceicoccus sp. YJ47 TaxID=2798724 RepID=UPI001923451B|nr:OB-fold domain-containing protein [Croceicoccus sp. YJ47]QQN73405.1 OB-fold domain-containing protein [Croceicoccus sp. YJ47]